MTNLNNEFPIKNQTYYERFTQLERLVLIKFTKDVVIYPRNSSWFEFIDKNRIKFEESDFYLKDYIGFKKLMNERR